MDDRDLKLGIIGLDSSHVSAFARLLNDQEDPFHLEGAKIVWAYPGIASMDFDFSFQRIEGYTKEQREELGVTLLESEEETARLADAVFLEQVDSRKRVEQFSKIAPFGKPVFVDKAFALSVKDAKRMIALAEEYKVPLLSCSALRYDQCLNVALADDSLGTILGADFFGPMPIQPTQNLYFWYGVHMADMLFRTMGSGCETVTSLHTKNHDFLTGRWSDGRIGTVRGCRGGPNSFGGVIHRAGGDQYLNSSSDSIPYYASLLMEILKLFRTGIQPYSNMELLEVISFLEAANKSKERGAAVKL